MSSDCIDQYYCKVPRGQNHNLTPLNSHQQATKYYQTATKCFQAQHSISQDQNVSKHATKRDVVVPQRAAYRPKSRNLNFTTL